MSAAQAALDQVGYRTESLFAIPYYKIGQHDLIICARPNGDICEFLQAAIRAGKPVILDLDDDFYSIPVSNPAYKTFGPGNPEYIRKLKQTVNVVTVLTVPQMDLGQRYQARDVRWFPNTWDADNPAWCGPYLSWGRKVFTIGWAGTATHLEDFEVALPALTQFFAQTDARLVVGGDPDIYHLFDFMAPGRRAFLGYMNYKDYPSMYRYFDLLVAPLVDDRFNQAKSDIKLVEAGARGIPWLASAVGPYLSWGQIGGFLCKTTEQWLAGMMLYYTDPDRCARDGEIGRISVGDRTATKVGEKWLALVEEVLNGA
jgi:glycosyltransferase involved in cell wall biosynthesis